MVRTPAWSGARTRDPGAPADANGNLSDTKPVGSGVHEFKIDFGPGYRVYFGRDEQKIVLLLTGGNKQRQQSDINAAITYWADHKRRTRA